MILDAHQHFWQFDPVRDAWIDDHMHILQRDFLPPALKTVLAENGVDACVAVQADQSETETRFLHDLAGEFDFIKGVVGWVDLRAANIGARLDYFAQFPKLKGFRHIVQGEVDVNFMLRPAFRHGISLLGKHSFTYDILVFPHQLGAALELVKSFPNQKFVIDHLAKPYIKDGFFDGWAALMRELSRCDNVWCKVSGLVTEADWAHWKYEDFVPYLDLAFETFGPRRLMYGSDWPVCLLGGTYREAKGILECYLAPFSAKERAQVWGKNALLFYDISENITINHSA